MIKNSNSICGVVLAIMFLSVFLSGVSAFAQDNYDFRKVNWGMTQDEVEKNEGDKLLGGDEDILIYDTSVLGNNVTLGYTFVNNKLVRTNYRLADTYSNRNEYITVYYELLEALSSKYGESSYSKPLWKNDLYKDDSDHWGMAIAVGHLTLESTWDTPSTRILLQTSGNNYEIQLIIQYSSKELNHLEEEQKEKKTMDQL